MGGRAELVNELARGGGGAGSPQVGWVGRPEMLMNQPELFFTDYNNNIIPPTTWGVNPLLINIYYYSYFSKKKLESNRDPKAKILITQWMDRS